MPKMTKMTKKDLRRRDAKRNIGEELAAGT
jgi:hypothetical protein